MPITAYSWYKMAEKWVAKKSFGGGLFLTKLKINSIFVLCRRKFIPSHIMLIFFFFKVITLIFFMYFFFILLCIFIYIMYFFYVFFLYYIFFIIMWIPFFESLV